MLLLLGGKIGTISSCWLFGGKLISWNVVGWNEFWSWNCEGENSAEDGVTAWVNWPEGLKVPAISGGNSLVPIEVNE